jgi:hypothetical protein
MLEHYYRSQPDPQAVRGALTSRHHSGGSASRMRSPPSRPGSPQTKQASPPASPTSSTEHSPQDVHSPGTARSARGKPQRDS